MKVQIFPNSKDHEACEVKKNRVGALTFKPTAYTTRPWETTSTTVVNYFTGVGTLEFHHRGGHLARVTGAGWLEDRVRFGWDGLRRRRLTTPVVGATPAGWATALGVWYTRVYHRRVRYSGVDGFTPQVGWYTRVYRGVTHRGGPTVGVALDSPWWATVYHGGYAPVGVVAVAFPGATPYEVDHTHRGPTGGATPPGWSTLVGQVLGSTSGGATLPGGVWWDRPTRVQTVFQVSPLQRVLLG